MAPPIGSLNWRPIPAARHPPPNRRSPTCPQRRWRRLRSDDFEFAPLLPDEDAPLADRVAALAAWCGGFLYGVGTGASEQAIAAAGDVGEFLRDLADIARAELEPGRGGRCRARAISRSWSSSCARAPSSPSRSSRGQGPMRQDEFARRRRLLMRHMGARRDRDPAGCPGAHAQQRRRVPLPPGQRLLLPDCLRGAGGRRRADSRPAAGRIRAVRARPRPGARGLGRHAGGSRGRGPRLRRRRCLPGRRHRRDPAGPARAPLARVLHRWARTRSSTSA